jgi:hypothetical protein
MSGPKVGRGACRCSELARPFNFSGATQVRAGLGRGRSVSGRRNRSAVNPRRNRLAAKPGPGIALRVVVSAIVLAGLAAPAGASAAGFDLGPAFGAIAVDDAGQHVFVSDPQNNSVYEFDFSGDLLATVPGVAGATGMLVSGDELYVAENTTGQIAKIALSVSPLAPTTLATGLDQPRYLAMTAGRLWVAQTSSVASVDPTTGSVGVLPATYSDPDLATSPGAPATLFIADDGGGPGSLFRLDVSTAPPTTVLSIPSTNLSNIAGLVVSPDGTRVIPASGGPYYFEELDSSTLQPDGVRYPGQPWPVAVAVSASGELAAGLQTNYTGPDLEVMPLGTTAPTFSTTLRDGVLANIAVHGLAISADGRTVFAVTELPDGDPTFFAVPTFAPAASTGGPSAVTASGATLAATVNPQGAATTYTFEYGKSTSFGAITPVSSAGQGTAAAAESATLAGLASNTTYYYRVVAANSQTTTFGAVRSFTTAGPQLPPTAVTLGPSTVTNSGAGLAGQVDPNGQATAFTFEYGTSTSFGSISPVVELDDANAVEPVAATLTGLAPDTTYLYRVVAVNATGSSSGAVMSFTTGPGAAPIVSTGAAGGITATGATLAGTVDPQAAQTSFAFEYGTTTSFGHLSPVDNAGSSIGAQAVSLPIGGLAARTTYLYRIVASNLDGTTTGAVRSLVTGPAS